MRKPGLILCTLLALAACEEGTGLDLLKPGLDVAPTALDFGSVYVGANVQAQFTITNSGDGPLRLGPVDLQSLGFSVGDVPEFVAAGTDFIVTVDFGPTEVGPSQGTLRMSTNTPNGASVEVAVMGIGLAPLDCDDNNPCTQDSFESQTGTCLRAPSEGACDDGSACTDNDRCVASECIGRAITCDDGVECTRDLCDPETGCVGIGDDSKCVDTDPCTLDQCQPTGCANPPAPDGHICGEVVACISAEICVLRQCIQVAIPEGAPCDDEDGCTVQDQCSAQSCVGIGINRPPTKMVSTTMVEGTTSGTFVGEKLYVATPIGARQRFKVVGFDGQTAAPTRSLPNLQGNATLAQIGTNRWARVVTSSTGEQRVEVIDSSNPGAPTRVASAFGGYGQPDYRTITALGSMVFYCAASGPNAPPQLAALELSDLSNIPSPLFLEDRPCQNPATSTAIGDIWVAWRHLEDIAEVTIYRLFPGDVSTISAMTHVMDDAAALGEVKRVVIAGNSVIVDLEHPSQFFVYDLSQTPPPQYSVALPDEAQLLAAAQNQVLFALGQDIIAYDFADPAMPVRLPGQATLDAPVTETDLPIAMRSTRFALASQTEGLKIMSLDANGVANTLNMRGTGHFGHMFMDPSGVIGIHAGGATLVDPDRLPAPNLLSTPTSVRLPLESPHLVDGPSGPLGLFSPLALPVEHPCPSMVDVICGRAQSVPADWPLGTVGLSSGGTISATLTPPGLTGGIRGAARGCIGAGYDVSTTRPRFVVFDRCMIPGQLHVVGELPADYPRVRSANWPRVKIHANDIAGLSAQTFAVLLDYQQPFTPVIIAEQSLSPGPYAGFLDSAYDGKYWVLTWKEDGPGPTWLKILDIEAGGRELHRMAFDPALGRITNVLALDWPLLYVGTERAGDASLLVYDLSQATPELIHTLPLDSPAIDLVGWRDQLYLARADGLTVIEPACASE